jgi:hypothetical protein
LDGVVLRISGRRALPSRRILTGLLRNAVGNLSKLDPILVIVFSRLALDPVELKIRI